MSQFYDIIPAELYSPIYFIGLFVLCLLACLRYSMSTGNHVIEKNIPATQLFSILFSIVVIIFIGLRPISGKYFTDMGIYAHTYNNIYDGDWTHYEDSRGEWLFYLIGNTCKKLGLIDREFFLVISTLYFGLMCLVCWRLMRRNMFVALLFCFISFSCFSFGTNGIRNGLAASILMLAITFLDQNNKWNIIISLLLMFASVSIHKAMFLPSFCAIVALYFVKEPRSAIVFWILSIFISLVAGNYVTQFFSNLGFDDRMEAYANLDEYGELKESENVKAGFRLDFILYSIMPIIMVWYVTVKRNFKDQMYNIIASTYILANAFWVMVIRSEQSNRFAYLSWFIYPIVVAYPLLRMNIWENQDRKLALILLLYSGFTFFMEFVYYG